MTVTINAAFISNLATALIVMLTGLEGFNWVQLFDAETSMKIVAGVGLAKLMLNGWSAYATKAATPPVQ